MKKSAGPKYAQKPKKPFYKKWWFWVIVVFVLVAAFGGSGNSDSPAAPANNPASTPTVNTVSSPADNPASAPTASDSKPEAATQPASVETTEAFTIPQPQRYEEGMYKVGSDIDAGEYYVTCENYVGAYVEVAKDSSGTIDSIVANNNVNTFTFITVSDGQYFTVTGGEFVKAEDAAVPGADLNNTYMAGMYRVGTDIPAGEYKVNSTSEYGAYVEVAKDSLHTIDSIVTNENVSTSTYITVSDGQYLTVTGGEFSPA